MMRQQNNCPENRGNLNVGYGALPSAMQDAAKTAVANWKSVTQASKSKDAVNLAPTGADVQVDVVQTGYSSLFDGRFGLTCQGELGNHGGSYAWTDALNINNAGVSDSNQNGWWDPAELSKPFAIARACLNAGVTNDYGTIAHELGHAQGLNHPIYNGGSCPDNGSNTIMAYNYIPWQYLWPPDLKPTTQDVVGPWVCNPGNAAGTNYVYNFSNASSQPAPAYFVAAYNPSSKVLQACFYDQSSVEQNYFLKAFFTPGSGSEGGFVSNVPGTNTYACRNITVQGGKYYHLGVYSYSGASGQFSVQADQLTPNYWIYIP